MVRGYIGFKRVLFLLALIAFRYRARSRFGTGSLNPALIERYRDDHPVDAAILFVVIYAVSVTAAVSSLPLNLVAGFFWGGTLGGAYSALGATVGSWISFAVARRLIGRPLADRFDNKWVRWVQREFDRAAWKFVTFARINPIIPTGPLNYLLGLTSLSHWDFLWGTFVFLLPLSVVVNYIGGTFQAFSAQPSGIGDILRDVLIASAAVTFLVGNRFVRKIFKEGPKNNEHDSPRHDP